MSIIFDKENKLFHISTEGSSYIMGLCADGILCHIYYGARLRGELNFKEVYPARENGGFMAMYENESKYFSLANAFQEYPSFGADARVPSLGVEYSDGTGYTVLIYESHKIYNGKPTLEGLPAVYADENEAETLEITLKDKYSQMRVVLLYTVIKGFDAVMRSAKISNQGDSTIKINTALSACLDYYLEDCELTYLQGSWGHERHIKKLPINGGNFTVSSNQGASSHALNPFIAISDKGATETDGWVYGLSLVYSGNFVAGVESSRNTMRSYIGINPFNFGWELAAGESFQTPEAVLTFSKNGFGDMSRIYHKLYRTHLCRGIYRDSSRPVLINNWEATYLDFDEDKILEIGETAAKCGIDLLVLDDGWFGERNSCDRSLGDWVPNLAKLPNGVGGLAKKINALGMKFGLWFEPEMISANSDLYRAHPDWCLHIEGRTRSEARRQLILDLSRPEVCDYVIKALSNVLDNANIGYVKWDMNRNMSEIGSAALPAARQREVPHRYMLGLYRILEEITSKYPKVLFESCSGGGGRFDAGMMYYMPQCWVSDDTDAVERLYIQYGTSMAYASSMMGAHVSAVPNHQVGRTTPFEMRGLCAMMGRFGYELNLAKLSDEEITVVKAQVKKYREIEDVVHHGDMYRILSPFEGDTAAFQFISENKNKILMFYFNIKANLGISRRVKFQALDPKASYRLTVDEKMHSNAPAIGKGEAYSGDVLMNIGICLPMGKDNISILLEFEKL